LRKEVLLGGLGIYFGKITCIETSFEYNLHDPESQWNYFGWKYESNFIPLTEIQVLQVYLIFWEMKLNNWEINRLSCMLRDSGGKHEEILTIVFQISIIPGYLCGWDSSSNFRFIDLEMLSL